MAKLEEGGHPADPSAQAHCPHCAAPAERGQLVCLECGSRVALTYRRPPSWKVPVAIGAAVLALFLIAAVVAVAAIRDDARREVAAAPPRPQPPERAKKKPAPAKPRPAAAKPAPATGIVRRGALYAWPQPLVGFTVVINSTEDRASATTFAKSAARSRPAKIGVIRADDFRTLPKGFYVVFAGYHATRAQADQATARLGKRFSGAFTQRVKR